MDLHDEGGGQIFNSDSSKIIQRSSPNTKDIGTKHSLGKANLSSSIITPEVQSILILMML